MDSKKALAIVVGFPCSVLLFFILMISLWEYRVFVGTALLLLIFIIVGVFLRGIVTEQNLRVYRFDHTTETPLDATGEPRLWRQDMQANPHRSNGQQAYYQGYRQE